MDVANVAIPLALITVSSVVSIRRTYNFVASQLVYYGYDFHEEEEYVEGEEDLIPKPEPLGRAIPQTEKTTEPESTYSFDKSFAFSNQQPQQHIHPQYQEYKIPPHDLDTAALRSRLIDADAAKRRFMSRVLELERETESLRRKCAELERKTSLIADGGLHQMGISQRFISLLIPSLKGRRRGMLW